MTRDEIAEMNARNLVLAENNLRAALRNRRVSMCTHRLHGRHTLAPLIRVMDRSAIRSAVRALRFERAQA